jgi:small subunit ribosomal protein S7
MIVIDALKIVEQQTKQNPLAVLAKAIENASPRDEVTAIEYGGARYPQAVDISPRRRLNLTLRFIVNGAYDKAFNKKATIVESLAKELMLS